MYILVPCAELTQYITDSGSICHSRINYLALIRASDILHTVFFYFILFFVGLAGLLIRPKYFPLHKSNSLRFTPLGQSPTGVPSQEGVGVIHQDSAP